jgi:hypothetical protein
MVASLPEPLAPRARHPRPRRPHHAEQAAKADDLVDEAIGVGHGRSDPLVTHAKMLSLEILKVKADLEHELEDFSLNCSKCGLDVHWISGLGVTPGHWAHREPAPHGEPTV